jgi:cysteamine dioxygenase
MRECMEMCDGVTLAELNISEADIEAMERQRLCRCMHVCDDDNFEMNIFIIPKGKSLPFHDHPGMTVVSKVVRGTLRLRSLSQIRANDNPPLSKRARTAASAESSSPTTEVKTPSDPAWFLSPTIGNYHELFAESTCIVFDVLMPPYKPPERDCTYYKLSADGSSLERASEPEDSDAVWGAKYAGARVVQNQKK